MIRLIRFDLFHNITQGGRYDSPPLPPGERAGVRGNKQTEPLPFTLSSVGIRQAAGIHYRIPNLMDHRALGILLGTSPFSSVSSPSVSSSTCPNQWLNTLGFSFSSGFFSFRSLTTSLTDAGRTAFFPCRATATKCRRQAFPTTNAKHTPVSYTHLTLPTIYSV